MRLGYDEGSPRQMLTWNYVEKRIGELIKLDRYLNSKEKEYYPRWLERQEELRAERAAERKSVNHFLRRRQKSLSLSLLSLNTDIRLALRYISAQASMKSSPLMMTV